MNYFLVNRAGMALSQFAGNDKTDKAKQIYFRKRDWYTYSSKEEAEKHKAYIMREANDRVKKSVAKLTISTDCKQYHI